MDFSNFVPYFTDLINSGRVGAYISLGIFGYVLLSVLSGLFFGIKRGFSKTLIRTITIVASAVGAVLVCYYASGALSSFLEGKTLEEVLKMALPNYEDVLNEQYRNIIACFDLETAALILKLLLCLIVLPIAFGLLFVIFNVVTMLIYAIISAAMGLTNYRKGAGSVIGGAVLGMVEGALIALVLLIPVSGFIGVASDARVALDEGGMPDETMNNIDAIYTEFVDDSINNPLLGGIRKFGGDAVFGLITSADVGGEKVRMDEKVTTLATIVSDAMSLKGTNWKEPSQTAKDALLRVTADLGDDSFTAEFVSGILRGVGKAVDTGAVVIPIPDPFGAIVKDALAVLKDSEAHSIKEDLDTFLGVYFILADHGVLDAFTGDSSSALTDMLITKDADGNTAINLVIDKFKENDRTKPLVSSLAKLSVSIMSNSMDMSEGSHETYTAVHTEVKDILTLNKSDYANEDEYKADVSNKLDSALKEQDINVEPEILSEMTEYIASNYGDAANISDIDVDMAILSYYDAYLKSLETSDEP